MSEWNNQNSITSTYTDKNYILSQSQSVSNVWQMYYFRYILANRNMHEFKSNIRAAHIGLQIGLSISRLSMWFWYIIYGQNWSHNIYKSI